jgi:hypothetical protein
MMWFDVEHLNDMLAVCSPAQLEETGRRRRELTSGYFERSIELPGTGVSTRDWIIGAWATR